VRLTTDDDIHVRTTLGYLHILLVARMSQSYDDIDALTLKFLCFLTAIKC